MHNKGHTLEQEYYIQQFPNNDHYPEHHDEPRTMWWEMGPEEKKPQGYASGGSVIASMRKRGRKSFGSHPLHGIPGIHIITAEAGEPIFTGEK